MRLLIGTSLLSLILLVIKLVEANPPVESKLGIVPSSHSDARPTPVSKFEKSLPKVNETIVSGGMLRSISGLARPSDSSQLSAEVEMETKLSSSNSFLSDPMERSLAEDFDLSYYDSESGAEFTKLESDPSSLVVYVHLEGRDAGLRLFFMRNSEREREETFTNWHTWTHVLPTGDGHTQYVRRLSSLFHRETGIDYELVDLRSCDLKADQIFSHIIYRHPVNPAVLLEAIAYNVEAKRWQKIGVGGVWQTVHTEPNPERLSECGE